MSSLQATLALQHAYVTQLEKASPGSLELAMAYAELGSILNDMEEWDTAQTCYEKALEIDADTQRTMDRADACQFIGLVMLQLGELDRAGECWMHAMASYDQVAPKSEHLEIICNDYGCLLEELGRNLKEAGDCFQKSTSIQEQDDAGMSRACVHFGRLLEEGGEWREANKWYQSAAELLEHSNPGSVDLANAYHRNGLVLIKHGDIAAALPFVQRSLEIYERTTAETLFLVNIYKELGEAFGDQGNTDEARQYFHKALAVFQDVEGSTASSVPCQVGPSFVNKDTLADPDLLWMSKRPRAQ